MFILQRVNLMFYIRINSLGDKVVLVDRMNSKAGLEIIRKSIVSKARYLWMAKVIILLLNMLGWGKQVFLRSKLCLIKISCSEV